MLTSLWNYPRAVSKAVCRQWEGKERHFVLPNLCQTFPEWGSMRLGWTQGPQGSIQHPGVSPQCWGVHQS